MLLALPLLALGSAGSDEFLCSSGDAVTARWFVDALAPPPPAPNPACTAELRKECPRKPGEDQTPSVLLGCLDCSLTHPFKDTKCTKAEKTQYCTAPYLVDHKLSADCGTALVALTAQLAKDLPPPGEDSYDFHPPFAAAAEAVATWGTSVSDLGQYYACNTIAGYSYWKVAFDSPRGDRNSSHGGGPHRRLQHYHHHYSGCYGEKEMGLCLPNECGDQEDIKSFATSFIGVFHKLEAQCATKPMAPPFNSSGQVMLGVVCLLVVLCVAATINGSDAWEAFATAMPLQENVEARASKLVQTFFPGRAEEIAKMSLMEKWQFVQAAELQGSAGLQSLAAQAGGELSRPLLPSSKPKSASAEEDSWFMRILSCWDCGTNWYGVLFKVDGGIPEMRVLNGIRALSMGWIVLGHTYENMEETVKNEGYALAVSRRLISEIIPNGQNAVDSFFFLSGFLGAYVGMRKLAAEDRRGRQTSPFGLAGMFYLERYLRLTPIYLFVLMIYMYLLPHLESGPSSGDSGYDTEFCQKYVWTNLLYVSNLYPQQIGHTAEGNLGCMDWSWYLSVDFQLHLLTPWLLVLFRYKQWVCYAFTASLIGLSWIYNAAMVHYYNGGVCGERGFFSQEDDNLMVLEYDKPWTRCGPFLVGVILACYFSANALPSGHLPAPGTVNMLLGYVCFGFLMLVCVFAPYWALPADDAEAPCNAGPESPSSCCLWPEWWDIIYTATRVTFWGSCVGFLTFASLCAQGGPLTKFLCWSFWSPLARLTFAWYLMHPMWMDVLYDSSQSGIMYYDLLGASFYVANCVMGLLCAFVIFFLVEAPALRLKVLLLPQLFKIISRLSRGELSLRCSSRTRPLSPRPDPRLSEPNILTTGSINASVEVSREMSHR